MVMDKGMVDALPAESSVSFKQHTPKWRERTKCGSPHIYYLVGTVSHWVLNTHIPFSCPSLDIS